jgi:hypothetical protein
LFKPSDTMYVPFGSDNGTPVQKDEPQAENGPNGVPIDYFLGASVSGSVTIEIIDASGATVRTFGGAQQGAEQGGRGGGGGIPTTTALWRPTPEPFAMGPGMHRVVWTPVAAVAGGQGGRRGGGTPLSGSFTAKLTANGKSYTQTFTVKRPS